MQPTRDLIGKTLQGVTLIAKLASNPASTLYLGEEGSDKASKELVILTDLHAYVLSNSAEQASFIEDAQLLQRLEHPFILPVILFGLDEEVPYFATKFVIGRTLQTRLRRKGLKASSLSESLHILTQISQTLHHAHQHGVVHGALSPRNVLFNDTGDALLTGFSFPTLSRKNDVIFTQQTKEQPCLAPEQRSGTTLPASDQYALGCLAYMLCTGHWPFSFTTEQGQQEKRVPLSPYASNPALPENLSEAILKALRENPEERYGNVAEFVEALLEIQKSTGIAFPVSPAYQEYTEKQIAAGIPTQSLDLLDSTPALFLLTHTPPAPVAGLYLADYTAKHTPPPNPSTPYPTIQDTSTMAPIHLEKAKQEATSGPLRHLPALQPSTDLFFKSRQKYGRRARQRILIGSICVVILFLPPFFLLFSRFNSEPQHTFSATAYNATASTTGIPNQLTPSGTSLAPTVSSSPSPIHTPTTASTPSAQAIVYSFEDGSLDGWSATYCNISNSTTVAESGHHSLEVIPQADASSNPYTYVSGSFTIPVGQVITAYVYIPAGTVQVTADISLLTSDKTWHDSAQVSLSQGMWNQLIYTMQPVSSPVTEVGVDLYFATSGGAINPAYIDNVSW